jgi:hypothetical protein
VGIARQTLNSGISIKTHGNFPGGIETIADFVFGNGEAGQDRP